MRILVIRKKEKGKQSESGEARTRLRYDAVGGLVCLCAVLGAMLCAAPFRTLSEKEGIAAAGASLRRELEAIPVVASALGLDAAVDVSAEPLTQEIADAEPRFSYLSVSAEEYVASPPVRAFAPIWPVDATPVSGFSWRDNPLYDGTNAKYDYHTGVDLPVVVGTSVAACDDGTVTDCGCEASRGNYLVLDHGNGWESVYCHLFEIHCAVGDSVKQGEEIALSGQSGRVTGAHLHFEIRKNGEPVDPTDYLP